MGMDQIKHVVILMQENRSFDEYFGTFPGAAGFQDPAGAFTDQYGNGILPFRMSTFTSSGLQRDGNGHDWDTFKASTAALRAARRITGAGRGFNPSLDTMPPTTFLSIGISPGHLRSAIGTTARPCQPLPPIACS